MKYVYGNVGDIRPWSSFKVVVSMSLALFFVVTQTVS